MSADFCFPSSPAVNAYWLRYSEGWRRADVSGLIFRRGVAIVLLAITAALAACVIAGRVPRTPALWREAA